MSDIDTILDRFPKERPPMTAKEASVHTALMKKNRERLTLFTRVSDILESWMHRQAARHSELPLAHRLLEIGAGTLNHLPFESPEITYDVVEPTSEMYLDKNEHERIRRFYGNISEIEVEHRYDRIVSIATLEHVTDLPDTVARAGLLLEQGGVFRCGIPSEGGLIWGLSWRLIGLDLFLRTGHDWSQHMRHEHVNSAAEIIAVIRNFFESVKIRRFPLPFHHLSFYVAIEARDPRLDRCHAYTLTAKSKSDRLRAGD